MIELLHERVQYHKDKFISPVLHHELETLEVDSKGKTQAIYPNHDDQVFSYLMALYVWYDGKDLAENFGITKNILRTDEDIEELDSDIDKEETKERLKLEDIDVDIEVLETEEAQMQKKFLADAKRIKTRKEYEESTYDEEQAMFNTFLSMHKDAKEAYEQKYHIQPIENSIESHFVKLPDSVYGNISYDSDIDLEEAEQKRKNGNLFDIFSQV